MRDSAEANAKEAESPSRSKRLSTVLVLLFFALGLMSKPMLVTLPFVLLLLDYWPLGRVTSDKWRVTRFRIPVPQLSSLNHLLLEKLPFLLLSAASCVATVLAQGSHQTHDDLPLTLRLDNALISYCHLHRADGLAGQSGCVLSLPFRYAGMADCRVPVHCCFS